MQNHHYRQQKGQPAVNRPGVQGGPYSDFDRWQDGLTGTATVRQPDGGPGGNVIHDTYVIQGVIGSGSGGIVYKAWHRRLQKYVVLKKMKVSRSSIAENRRETDILKRLRHSYLPGVIDFIDVKFYGIFGLKRWPTFNVADSAVVVCGIMLVISFIVAVIKGRKQPEAGGKIRRLALSHLLRRHNRADGSAHTIRCHLRLSR